MGFKIKTPQTKNDWWRIVETYWEEIYEFCQQTLDMEQIIDYDSLTTRSQWILEMKEKRDEALASIFMLANSETWINHQEAYNLPGFRIVELLVLKNRECLYG
jgi:hypothetical protein